MFISQGLEGSLRHESGIELRSQGEALERELNRPIRVLGTRQQGRSLSAVLREPWSGRSGEPRHYEVADSAAELSERGITIYDYSWNLDDFGTERPCPQGQQRHQQ